MSPSLQAKFDSVIRRTLNLAESHLLSEIRYGQPSNWDSIRHVELIIALQREFNISFNPSEIVKSNSYTALLGVFLLKVQI